MILCEEAIENYKAFKKLYKNENNGLTVINIALEKIMQDSNMIQGENKEVVKYNRSKKDYYWLDKTLRYYKDKQKIEDKNVIISTLKNGEKLMLRLHLR